MGSGIPIIGKNDLLSQHPILVQNFWDFKNNVKQPYEYLETSGKKVLWICPKCHKSYTALLERKS